MNYFIKDTNQKILLNKPHLRSSARFGLAVGRTLAIGHAPLTALAFASLANLIDYFPGSFVNSS